MIFEKRLKKENDSAWLTCTIALEEWFDPYWKFRVTVWKDKWSKHDSTHEPDIKTYGFPTEEEGKAWAETQVTTFQEYGYS